jgi:hypothetical protein
VTGFSFHWFQAVKEEAGWDCHLRKLSCSSIAARLNVKAVRGEPIFGFGSHFPERDEIAIFLI